MRRRIAVPIVLLVLFAWLAPSVAPAGDVLDAIPGNALGFVVVNRLAETDDKVLSAAEAMQLLVPSPLYKLKEAAGVKEGLDEAGTAAVVAMPGDDPSDRPRVMLIVPVSDFAKLVEPLDAKDPGAPVVETRTPPALMAKRGGYVLVVEKGNRAMLDAALQSPNRAAAELGHLRPWLDENDAVAVATTQGVRLACDKILEGIRTIRGVVQASGQENPGLAVFELYEQGFAAAREQVISVAVGIAIDAESTIRVTKRVRAAPGSDLAALVAEAEPGRDNLLAGLPAGPFVVAGGGALPKGAIDAMMRVSGRMMKSMPQVYGMTEEQVDELIALSSKSMSGVRGMSAFLGVGNAGAPVLSDWIFTMWLDDAGQYLETYEEAIETMNRLAKQAKSPVMAVTEVTRIEIDGRPGLEVQSTMPTPPGVEGVPDFADLMEKLLGPGGKVVMLLARADAKTVVAAYTSKEPLERSIEAVAKPEAGLAADEHVAKTTAMLPAHPVGVAYWSPKGTVDFARRMIPLFVPEPDAVRLPDFPDTPPVGFALTTAENEARWHVVVPGEVLKAIGAYVRQVQKTVGAEKAL